jgi:hypothetical protein
LGFRAFDSDLDKQKARAAQPEAVQRVFAEGEKKNKPFDH